MDSPAYDGGCRMRMRGEKWQPAPWAWYAGFLPATCDMITFLQKLPRKIRRSLSRAAMRLEPATVLYKGNILPARRYRFGGIHFLNESFLTSGEAEARRLIDHMGLTRDSRVLEIGCGPGRLPTGIISVLGDIRLYRGIDVSVKPILWCQKYITPVHPSFQFTHLDMHNDRYNPKGHLEAEKLRLSLPDHSFDIIYLYSVFSHLRTEHVRFYLGEFRRLLAPGGRVFLTAFLEEDVPDMAENPDDYRTVWVENKQTWKGALHCVRYNKKFFWQLAEEAGLTVVHFTHGVETDKQSGVYLALS